MKAKRNRDNIMCAGVRVGTHHCVLIATRSSQMLTALHTDPAPDNKREEGKQRKGKDMNIRNGIASL